MTLHFFVFLQAEAAAEFINRRVPGTRVIPHNCMIQDYDETFYKQFHIIVCGLVSNYRLGKVRLFYVRLG